MRHALAPRTQAPFLLPSTLVRPETSGALRMREDEDENLRRQGAERRYLRASSCLFVDPIEALDRPGRDRRIAILLQHGLHSGFALRTRPWTMQ